MVMQTPFERVLSELGQIAQREPLAAFARLQEAYNKSLTEADVQHLCTFAAGLGGALGRWDDVLTFLTTLLDHNALPDRSPVRRSIIRAQAVMHRCKGDLEKAEECIAAGVTGDSERCRVELMTAQTLARVGRVGEAVQYLEKTEALSRDLPEGDDLLDHIGVVCMGIGHMAEQQIAAARHVLLATSATAKTAGLRGEDWRRRHQAHYQRGRACVISGLPREALAEVQQMMRLEAQNEGGATQRFFSAALAAQAQILRGQYKVAGGAADAARGHVDAIEDEQVAAQARQMLAELDEALAN